MLQGVSLWAPYGYHIYSVSSLSKRILQDCRISDSYKRCIHVDNTLTIMQDVTTEKTFHPSFFLIHHGNHGNHGARKSETTNYHLLVCKYQQNAAD